MNRYMIFSGLVFLVPGLVAIGRPDAMLAFDRWVATRLWRRPPWPNDEARVRKTGVIETLAGALLIAAALF